MGRYSSVQAYSDTNKNVRAVSYEQATGSTEVKKGAVKPEKVSNPYGATAGANSGDFHVYRHARSREMERMNHLDEVEEEAEKDLEYEQKLNEYKTEEEGRTDKRRRKRQREKEAKMRKKALAKAGIATEVAEQPEFDEEEFSYEPVVQQKLAEKDAPPETKVPAVEPDGKLEIPNDGSFLEMMKRKLEEEAKKSSNAVEDEEPPLKRHTT